jgi:hypothetical protein
MSDKGFPAQREFIDIQAIADEIRNRIEQRFPMVTPAGEVAKVEATSTTTTVRKASYLRPLEVTLPATDTLLRETSAGTLLVGQPPLAPQTMRGKIGQVLVSGVRRSLFWYTPQIQHFQQSVANAFRDHVRAFRELTTHVNALRARVQTIAQQVAAVEQIPKIESQIVDLAQAYGRLERTTANISSRLQVEIAAREQAERRLDAEIAAREYMQMRLEAEPTVRPEVASLQTKLLIQTHRIDSLVQQLRSLSSYDL